MTPDERRRILRKLQALHVRAERGSTPGERAAARFAAQQLERKYQITTDAKNSLSESGFDDLDMRLFWIGPKKRRTYIRDVLWRDYLLSNVCQAFRTSYFFTRNPASRDIPDTAYFLYVLGQPDDVNRFQRVFDYLSMHIELACEHFERRYHSHMALTPQDVTIMSYAVGLAHNLLERVLEEESDGAIEDSHLVVRQVELDHDTTAIAVRPAEYVGPNGERGLEREAGEDTPRPEQRWSGEGWRDGHYIDVRPPALLDKPLSYLELEESTHDVLQTVFGISVIGDLLRLRRSDLEFDLVVTQIASLELALARYQLALRPSPRLDDDDDVAAPPQLTSKDD